MGGTKGFGIVAGAAKGVAGAAGSAAATAAAASQAAVSDLSAAGASGAKRVGEAASNLAAKASSVMPDLTAPDKSQAVEAIQNTSDAVRDRLQSAASSGREYGAVIQSRLSESLEKQPLLLGAIGVAIGAGIASTFATTALEREVMGEQASAAHEKLQDLAGDVTDRAKQIASSLQDEAKRQGLTPDGAKTAAAGIGEKLSAVANAGRDSVTQRFTSVSK